MKTPLIINRPDLQSPRQRATSAVMTAFFWLLWAALWLPLLTLAAWAFFGIRFHLNMVSYDGYQGFAGLLGLYALVILLMSGSLLAWAKYNHLRFRGIDRRKPTPPPEAATLARHFGHDMQQFAKWRNTRLVVVHHDAVGSITRVDRLDPGATQALPLEPLPAEATTS